MMQRLFQINCVSNATVRCLHMQKGYNGRRYIGHECLTGCSSILDAPPHKYKRDMRVIRIPGSTILQKTGAVHSAVVGTQEHKIIALASLSVKIRQKVGYHLVETQIRVFGFDGMRTNLMTYIHTVSDNGIELHHFLGTKISVGYYYCVTRK